jgi:D-alanyl-D-alanine carboxypeptidase
MHNTNRLLDAYPGADGMKTGFICASGFNVVATATRGNKRLIAVVLGASSSTARAGKAAQMFERGFASNPLSWLMPSLGTVDALVPIAAAPPNLRDEICGKARHRPASDDDDSPSASTGDDPGGQRSFLLSSLRSPTPKASELMTSGLASPPIDVHVGPARKPGSPAAAMAATEPKRKSGAAAAAKPAPGAKPAAKPTAHAAVAPARGTDPAATASPAKPGPSEGTPAKPAATAKPPTGKPAVAKPAADKPAAIAKPAVTADKPKPTATLAPKPSDIAAKPKPTANPELKPSIAAEKPKPATPKPTVAAVKPKPAAPAPSAPRTEAQ